MTPYSETPLGHVELFDGVQHRYQLRVLYKVQLYEPFPSRSYTSSQWITLDGTGNELSSDTSEALACPEGTTTFSSSYPMRGKVTIAAQTARIEMQDFKIRRSGVAEWQPYEFNGDYRLVRPQDTPAQVTKAEAEAAAKTLGSSFINYRCEPVSDSHRK